MGVAWCAQVKYQEKLHGRGREFLFFFLILLKLSLFLRVSAFERKITNVLYAYSYVYLHLIKFIQIVHSFLIETGTSFQVELITRQVKELLIKI